MSLAIRELGCRTNIDVINEFVEIDDRDIVDAGCGSMIVSRQLAENGARVLAIDPDPVQAEFNRKEPPAANLKFAESGAEQIPAESESVDGVFFSYSLHHVPKQLYPAVFDEVLRILRPNGFLFVIEPTDCPLNEVMRLFHNEDKERALAQQSLWELAVPKFESVEEVRYHSFRRFESFDDFATHFASRTFNELYSESDVRNDTVKETFERLGAPEYEFEAPKQAMVLRNKKR